MERLCFFDKSAKKVCDDIENYRAVWPPKVENIKEITDFIESRRFVSNNNEEIMKIEKDIANFLGEKYFSFFDSGAAALHSALVACDVSYGDEVIVPSWTFPAPAFQVFRTGAIPIFADIKKDSYNIDEEDIERLLKKFKKVKAIIAVHMQGYPSNVRKIREIADRNNIYLIEDCAQAFGAKIDNKCVGTYGHIGCYSFMPVKQLASCGELGGISTDSLELFNNANSVKTYAQKIIEGDDNFYYNYFTYGYNYKPSAINCIFLKPQLENFDRIIRTIQKNAKKMTDFINNNIDFLRAPIVENGFEHVYHFYRVYCDTSKLGIKYDGIFRDTIMKILHSEGLTTRIYQTHPVYKQLLFQKIFDDCELYPWGFNKESINDYKENYSDSTHSNTLDVIDNSFIIGGISSAPHYFLNEEIVDLYIEALKKIKDNINLIIDYCNKNGEKYVSPYVGLAKLSDTRGVYKK